MNHPLPILLLPKHSPKDASTDKGVSLLKILKAPVYWLGKLSCPLKPSQKNALFFLNLMSDSQADSALWGEVGQGG